MVFKYGDQSFDFENWFIVFISCWSWLFISVMEKYRKLNLAPLMTSDEALRYGTHCQRISVFYLHTHAFRLIYPWSKSWIQVWSDATARDKLFLNQATYVYSWTVAEWKGLRTTYTVRGSTTRATLTAFLSPDRAVRSSRVRPYLLSMRISVRSPPSCIPSASTKATSSTPR